MINNNGINENKVNQHQPNEFDADRKLEKKSSSGKGRFILDAVGSAFESLANVFKGLIHHFSGRTINASKNDENVIVSKIASDKQIMPKKAPVFMDPSVHVVPADESDIGKIATSYEKEGKVVFKPVNQKLPQSDYVFYAIAALKGQQISELKEEFRSYIEDPKNAKFIEEVFDGLQFKTEELALEHGNEKPIEAFKQQLLKTGSDGIKSPDDLKNLDIGRAKILEKVINQSIGFNVFTFYPGVKDPLRKVPHGKKPDIELVFGSKIEKKELYRKTTGVSEKKNEEIDPRLSISPDGSLHFRQEVVKTVEKREYEYYEPYAKNEQSGYVPPMLVVKKQ